MSQTSEKLLKYLRTREKKLFSIQDIRLDCPYDLGDIDDIQRSIETLECKGYLQRGNDGIYGHTYIFTE